MSSNPYARDPLGVVLGDLEVRVPYAPADRWIAGVMADMGPLTVLVSLTDAATGDAVAYGVLDGRISVKEAGDAALDLLQQATPYRWWKTVRLIGVSCRDDIVGALTLKGLDPRRMPLAQWVTAVYVLLTQGADVKGKFKTDALLDEPPATVGDDWMSDEEFNAMVAQARAMPGQT